jgi:excisionase family DNA binding protein
VPPARGRLAGVPQEADVESLVTDWLTLPEAADRLGVPASRVRQLVADKQLVAVRRGDNNALMVPAEFLKEGRVLKGLPGTLTLLADGGFNDEESVRWLYTADETLPGTPVEALAANRGTEVKRRAQALGF